MVLVAAERIFGWWFGFGFESHVVATGFIVSKGHSAVGDGYCKKSREMAHSLMPGNWPIPGTSTAGHRVIRRALPKLPGTARYLLPWAWRLPPDRMVHRGGHRLGQRHQKLHQIARYAREIICQSRFANTPNKRAPLT
jgi:hypothetical protein